LPFGCADDFTIETYEALLNGGFGMGGDVRPLWAKHRVDRGWVEPSLELTRILARTFRIEPSERCSMTELLADIAAQLPRKAPPDQLTALALQHLHMTAPWNGDDASRLVTRTASDFHIHGTPLIAAEGTSLTYAGDYVTYETATSERPIRERRDKELADLRPGAAHPYSYGSLTPFTDAQSKMAERERRAAKPLVPFFPDNSNPPRHSLNHFPYKPSETHPIAGTY